ncbi:MAG: DUF1987 domain-containing protein [Bacteroidales bacterium]|nr:DUF1987 domain-containing protein [Bacteroidales bacterium]
MNIIDSQGNMKTPKVHFDPEQGLIELSGRSIPENTDSLYRPLIEWVEEYINNPQPVTTVNIKFEYFNSSSAKYLIRLLEYIHRIEATENKLIFNWYYEDEELLEYGQDFQEVLEMKFNFIKSADYKN